MEISLLGTEKIMGKLIQISFQGTGKIPTVFHLMEAKRENLLLPQFHADIYLRQCQKFLSGPRNRWKGLKG